MEYLHFLDSPKHISLFSSAKSRRRLEPSRNKASINLMMSQPLVVLISGYVWLMMLEDCFEYYKGCQDCQRFGNVQRSPAVVMNPIIKSCSFRGWRIDIIGQIYPPSNKGHKFIMVAMDYFTKWVEAIPLKTMMYQNMIDFVQEHIIYQFGIP